MGRPELPFMSVLKQEKRLVGSIGHLRDAYKSLGTPDGPGAKKWDLSSVIGLEGIERTLVVGVLKERIDQRLDILKQRLEDLSPAARNAKHRVFDEASRLAYLGHLSEDDLARVDRGLLLNEEKIGEPKLARRQQLDRVEPDPGAVALPFRIENGRAIFANRLVIKGRKAQALEILQTHFRGNPLGGEEFTVQLLGEDTQKARSNLSVIVQGLRQDLSEPSMGVKVVTDSNPRDRIRGERGKYYLELVEPSLPPQVIESQTGSQDVAPPARRQAVVDFAGVGEPKLERQAGDSEAARAAATTILGSVDRPVLGSLSAIEPISPVNPVRDEGVVPGAIEYVPPVEFIRTPLETDVLKVVANGLTEHNRLWFDIVQGALMSRNDDRRKERTEVLRPGISKVYIYTSQELYEAFREGYGKLKREQDIPALRAKLEIDEKSVWTRLGALRKVFRTSRDAQFLRRIKDEIEKCERDYYNTRRRQGDERPFIVYEQSIR